MKYLLGFVIIFTLYMLIGTSHHVDEIKQLAPLNMEQRGWKILRYEGFTYGSLNKHGGKVWYHVANTDNPSIQYRVHITLWNGELQYWYTAPEKLSRFDVNL